MVNPRLIAVAQALPNRKILVTGGTGFVGSHLARVLAAAGHDVISLGRNPYRIPLVEGGPTFVRGDLSDQKLVGELCNDRQLVYHVAALASPWGSKEEFRLANFEATQTVVEACLKHGVSRLVHVSSTAVQFDYRDQTGIREADPFAEPPSSYYAWSKMLAELAVQDGVKRGLNAVTIRARAMFGDGDNSLLPRLLAAADRGRLRQIGSRTTRIDLTYIDNFILALLLAAERGQSGNVYTITNDEPIDLWPFLDNLLEQTGRSGKLRAVSKSLALAMALLLETAHRILGRAGEPATTRYTVGVISTTKTFDISAARNDLGYAPIVSMATGFQETIAARNRRDDTPASVHVGLRVLTTGYTVARANLVEQGGSASQSLRIHATCCLIDHPVHGLTLFDTGYAPRFFDATRHWPYRLYRWITPVVASSRLAIVQQLRQQGIDPQEIRRVILSHCHADHVCGLQDFPNADILLSKRCWDSVRNSSGIRALKQAYLPDLVSADSARRVLTFDNLHGAGIGPFESCHDIFGDGSVRIIDISGHAHGQIGLLVQRGLNDRALLAADAAWTSRTIRDNLPLTLPFRISAASAQDAHITVRRLHELYHQVPNIELIPSHCPEVAARYLLDDVIHESAGMEASR